MSKLSKVSQKIFASSAGLDQISQFGSLAAGSAAYTTNPATAQSLSQWLSGWFAAVISAASPAIEDMNALFYVITYQLAYIMQEGVAEWDATTIYFKGSIVNSGGVLYVSLTDNNQNNALTSTSNWAIPGNTIRSVTSVDSATSADQYLRCDPTSGSFVETLPALSACALGQAIVIKNVATNGNTVTVTPNGSDNIDGVNSSVVLNSSPTLESLTLRKGSSTTWDIV